MWVGRYDHQPYFLCGLNYPIKKVLNSFCPNLYTVTWSQCLRSSASELYKDWNDNSLCLAYDWMKPKFRSLEEAMYVGSEQNIVQIIVQWPARKLSISGSTIVLEHIMINQYVLHQ